MSTTTKSRVAQITKILGDRVPRSEIEEAVAAFEGEVRYLKKYGEPLGRRDHWYRPSNKQDKRTARSLALAFARLDRQIQRADVERVLQRIITPAGAEVDTDFANWRRQLKQWRDSAEAFSNWPLQKTTSADKYFLRQRAVEIAADLLERHDLKLTVTRGRSTFCLVTALIGDERDLSALCRAFMATRKKSANEGLGLGPPSRAEIRQRPPYEPLAARPRLRCVRLAVAFGRRRNK